MATGEQLVVQPQGPSPSDRAGDEWRAARAEGAARAASSAMAASAAGLDAEWSGAGVITDVALLGGTAAGGLAVTSLLRP